jgi:hypothetical protein
MECTGRGALGTVAVEFGCRRVGAAAVAELRRSRRRAIERGQRKRARAPAGHGEAICVPGWARGQVGEAVDDGIDFGWRWFGVAWRKKGELLLEEEGNVIGL